jgi:hypothetical protein
MDRVDEQFEIALSFASEQRDLAKAINEILINEKIRIFYDNDHKAEFVGRFGVDYFFEIYSKAILCVPLLSKDYYLKSWPGIERMAITQRLMENLPNDDQNDFILPFVVDKSEVKGLFKTLCPEHNSDPEAMAKLILKKYETIRLRMNKITMPKITNAFVFVDFLRKYLIAKFIPLNIKVSMQGNDVESSIYIENETDTYELRFCQSCFYGHSKTFRLDGYMDDKKDYLLSMDVILNEKEASIINLGGADIEESIVNKTCSQLIQTIIGRIEPLIAIG